MSLVARLLEGGNSQLDRRTLFKEGFKDIMAGIALKSGLTGSYAHAQESNNVITLEVIAKEMQKGHPYEILKDCQGMIFINYDSQGAWKEKYFKEVFQEDKKEKKPVLVLFYDNDPTHKKPNLRESIIFKELYTEYNSNIKFILTYLPVNGGEEYTKMYKEAKAGRFGESPLNKLGIFKTNTGKRKIQLPPIRGPPSLVLYAPWEVIENESQKYNDGKVKLIDISYSGPEKNEEIIDWLYQCEGNFIKWIKSNLTPNNNVIYRESNTGEGPIKLIIK